VTVYVFNHLKFGHRYQLEKPLPSQQRFRSELQIRRGGFKQQARLVNIEDKSEVVAKIPQA